MERKARSARQGVNEMRRRQQTSMERILAVLLGSKIRFFLKKGCEK